MCPDLGVIFGAAAMAPNGLLQAFRARKQYVALLEAPIASTQLLFQTVLFQTVLAERQAIQFIDSSECSLQLHDQLIEFRTRRVKAGNTRTPTVGNATHPCVA
eukprot:TRINITY_DN23002_c0_g1_i1.p2 TRINITY_DN23002_c0_g1~~TRINITY_DN23002_c0_g1_i1.p2  ORF type:complete len:103 (+),score=19.26 TRINITY_DN23002_c0_g1_i1:421-729(+)